MQHFGDRDPAYRMQDASVQYNYRIFGPKAHQMWVFPNYWTMCAVDYTVYIHSSTP